MLKRNPVKLENDRQLKMVPRWPLWLIGILFIFATAWFGLALKFHIETSAITDYASFVASLLVAVISYVYVKLTYEYVRLTSEYVENSERTLAFHKQQWDKQLEVRPVFWFEIGGNTSEHYGFRVSPTESQSRSVREFRLSVWNYGQQSFRIHGGQISLRGDARLREEFTIKDVVVQPHEVVSAPITASVWRILTRTYEFSGAGFENAPAGRSSVSIAVRYSAWFGERQLTDERTFDVVVDSSGLNFAVTEVSA